MEDEVQSGDCQEDLRLTPANQEADTDLLAENLREMRSRAE